MENSNKSRMNISEKVQLLSTKDKLEDEFQSTKKYQKVKVNVTTEKDPAKKIKKLHGLIKLIFCISVTRTFRKIKIE